MRSLITGLLAGELLFALGALFAWDNPGALAAIGGISLLSLFVWWVSLRQSWRILGGDLGEVVEPERVRLQLNHQDGRGADWLDLPVELPRMIAIWVAGLCMYRGSYELAPNCCRITESRGRRPRLSMRRRRKSIALQSL